MKKNNNIYIFNLVLIIIIYYIFNNKSIFGYVLSINLYNIFLSCYKHLDLTKILNNKNTNQVKNINILTIIFSVITCIFTILAILTSDFINSFFELYNTFWIFFFMGLSTFIYPVSKLLKEYFLLNKKKKIVNLISYIVEYGYGIILIIISVIFFKILNINIDKYIFLLYIPSIIIIIILLGLIYIINIKSKDNNKLVINRKEIKELFKNNYHISIVSIIRNSYIYIGMIVVYLVLLNLYNYDINIIESNITIMYFYIITIINIYTDLIVEYVDKLKINLYNKIFSLFKINFTILVIIFLTSNYITKFIFNDGNIGLYLTMGMFLGLNLSLYDLINRYIKNTKFLIISILLGLIINIIILIPLINTIYRLGNNLIYGNILSISIGLSLTIFINYLFLIKKYVKKKHYFLEYLNILYENIVLCIILILVKLVFPLSEYNYFKNILIIILYIIIIGLFFNIKNKYISKKN